MGRMINNGRESKNALPLQGEQAELVGFAAEFYFTADDNMNKFIFDGGNFLPFL